MIDVWIFLILNIIFDKWWHVITISKSNTILSIWHPVLSTEHCFLIIWGARALKLEFCDSQQCNYISTISTFQLQNNSIEHFALKSTQHSGNTEKLNQLNNNKKYQLTVSNLISRKIKQSAAGCRPLNISKIYQLIRCSVFGVWCINILYNILQITRTRCWITSAQW